MNQLAAVTDGSPVPAVVVTAGRQAAYRFLEFFATRIRDPHTRRACGRPARLFRRHRHPGERRGAAVSHHWPRHWSANPHSPAGCQSLHHGAAASQDRRDRGQDRPPHVSRHRPHRLPRNGATLGRVAATANHASTRTTQLYGRPADEVNVDEIERILIWGSRRAKGFLAIRALGVPAGHNWVCPRRRSPRC